MFFFFNDTATTEIYTLSYTTLFRSAVGGRTPRGRSGAPHPRCERRSVRRDLQDARRASGFAGGRRSGRRRHRPRSEEHTSELQSRLHLVCRLLLEKKKKNKPTAEYS